VPEGTTWHGTVGTKLTVKLDEGDLLNAFYDRESLQFFHHNVSGVEIYSGEHPDVVCHELGHGVLDALAPKLFDAASAETSALHESFGDISALLSALRQDALRDALLAETQFAIEQSSRVSRMAEQLGWAIAQGRPTAVDPGCLRDASNSLFYRDPVMLPPSGPAYGLSSEPHSFSRVFTGAFLKALAGIFRQQNPDSQGLAEAARIAGQLLVDAVVAAPVVPGYYAQVAAHMIAADRQRHHGEYGQALRSAFVRQGILSLQGASSITEGAVERHASALAEAAETAAGPGTGTRLADITVPGEAYGLRDVLSLSAPAQQTRFMVAGSDPAGGSVEPAAAERVATSYVEDLFRRGRVGVQAEHLTDSALVMDGSRTHTHEIVPAEAGGGLALVRRRFD
jgi:hypothetical protein